MTKSAITAKAVSSTEYEGCNGLVDHDNQKWFDLGGVDVVVWGTDWTIYADDQAAIDYLVSVYSLDCVEIVAE